MGDVAEVPANSRKGSRHGAPWVAIALVAGIVLVVSRRTDALTNPQFFLEDGIWYQQAYEMGTWHSLVFPYFRGYFHLVPRLAAWLAVAVPFAWAPLTLTAVGVVVEALPAAFLCSGRLAAAIPSRAIRVLLAMLYVGLPNAWSPVDSTIANVTHAQWHLAPLACMAISAPADRRKAWRIADVAAVVAAGLSGPAGIFLVPVATLVWIRRRERWTLVLLGLAAVTALVQIGALLVATDPNASHPPVVFDPAVLSRLVAGRIVYGAFVGQTGYAAIFANPSSAWMSTATVSAVALALAGLFAWAGARAPFELRMFLLYTSLAFFAFLVWPVPSTIAIPHWELMVRPGHHRYFVAPTFALFAVLVWIACARRPIVRWAGIAALAVAIVFGVARDWREPPHPDMRFPDYARRFEAAAPGERVQVPFPPNWSIVLTKK